MMGRVDDQAVTAGARRRTGRLETRRAAFDRPRASPSGVQPFRRALRVLERHGVAFAPLREPDGWMGPAPGGGEMDLLVAQEDVPRLAELLSREGFLERPSWGHKPHRFYVAYDQRTGRWWKLDVVDDLRYGRSLRWLPVHEAKACLSRVGPDHRLSPEDELFTLVLHCMLDEARFPERHRRRLEDLVGAVESDPARVEAAVRWCDRWLAPVLSWDDVRWACRYGWWEHLLSRSRRVAWRLVRRDPRAPVRWLRTRAVRLMRPLLFGVCHRGRSLALLGADGAGKSTLARSLTAEAYLQPRRVYLGDNFRSSNVSFPTTRWIERKKTSSIGPEGGPARIGVRILHLVNRIAESWYRNGVIRYHLLRGRTVVFDRYPYRLPAASHRRGLHALARRLVTLGLPAPDLVVLLDAPGTVLHRRSGEHTAVRLERMRQELKNLAAKLPRIECIDATAPPGLIEREVVSALWALESTRAR